MGATTLFTVIGIASAVLLGIQLLLLMFGADMDFDADTDVDASDGGGFLSIRSLTGFFFGFGWAGLAARQADQGVAVSVVIGLAVGFGLFLLIGLMFSAFRRLTSSGNADATSAVGTFGTVYLTIGASRGRAGKIEVVVSGRVSLLSALTDAETDLPTRSRVRVVELLDPGTVLVEPA